MIHPDYQYDSRLVPLLTGFIAAGVCDVVLGSRIRTRREALGCGMPPYKYSANRALTLIENVALGQNLGECHSGFRAYSREVLQKGWRRESTETWRDTPSSRTIGCSRCTRASPGPGCIPIAIRK
jgi:hypothetical protein